MLVVHPDRQHKVTPQAVRHRRAPGQFGACLQSTFDLLAVIVHAVVHHIGPGHVGIQKLQRRPAFVAHSEPCQAVGQLQSRKLDIASAVVMLCPFERLGKCTGRHHQQQYASDYLFHRKRIIRFFGRSLFGRKSRNLHAGAAAAINQGEQTPCTLSPSYTLLHLTTLWPPFR